MVDLVSFPIGPLPDYKGPSLTKEVLGGKGWSLVHMGTQGIPVPPGFIIPCDVSNAYRESDDDAAFLDKLLVQVCKLWDGMKRPLVSVRSGAPVSMPGMMDTILNVGISKINIDKWAKKIGERAAWDSYRRLIQMMGCTAFGISHDKFEFQLATVKKGQGVTTDAELFATSLMVVAERFEKVFEANTGMQFPQAPYDQLRHAVRAVFDSWNNDRAIEYRRMNKLSETMGTAVVVQKMVFGNMGDTSGSGVLFTRNPSTGEPKIMAEYLPNAQGEDVVSGVRTPEHLNLHDGYKKDGDDWKLELLDVCHGLEAFYRDMVDVEFTVEEGKLYILQSRVGKRSALAAFRIAVDLADGGLPIPMALKTIQARQYLMATRPFVDPEFKTPPTMTGLAASPGVAIGGAVFSAENAVKYKKAGKPVILITHETTPDDIKGMDAAEGILTATGGATSHAAVVARAMDKPCVVGTTGLAMHDAYASYGATNIYELNKVTIDGSTGRAWVGIDVPIIDGTKSNYVKKVVTWCREVSGNVPIVVTPVGPECAISLVEVMQHYPTPDMFIDALKLAEGTVRLDVRQSFDYGADDDAIEHDKALLFIFGAGTNEQKYISITTALLEQYAAQLKGHVILIGIDPEEERHAALLKAGYKTVRGVSNVKDILGQDQVMITPSDITRLFGDERTFNKTLKAFEAAGITVNIAPRASHDETAVFAVLGG